MKKKQPKTELIKSAGFDRHFKAESWREYNRQFFENLAKKYDATNVLHCFGMKRFFDRCALKRLKIPDNAQILDLCCGSGDLAEALSRSKPTAQITGLDYSGEMLKIANKRLKNYKNIKLIEGDCLQLPFDDNTFDCCTIGYGLRNFESIEAGMLEMFRVTKPGGQICCIDLGTSIHPLFWGIYKIHFFYIAPVIGKLIFHRGEFNSFRYLPESTKYFPKPDQLIEKFAHAGFQNIHYLPLYFGAIASYTATKPD